MSAFLLVIISTRNQWFSMYNDVTFALWLFRSHFCAFIPLCTTLYFCAFHFCNVFQTRDMRCEIMMTLVLRNAWKRELWIVKGTATSPCFAIFCSISFPKRDRGYSTMQYRSEVALPSSPGIFTFCKEPPSQKEKRKKEDILIFLVAMRRSDILQLYT